MNQPVDFSARQQALDPEQSFAVSAPAGSGKTGLLTQRVLRLLERCQHPEEVLCITFTRKAAAEMSERILGALRFAASEPEPELEHDKLSWHLARAVLERDSEHHWALLDNPGRLRIQTIDGLCRSIAKQLPLSSGLGALPDTLEFPEQAYAQTVSDFLLLLKQESQTKDDLLLLLSHLDNNIETLESLLMSLLAKRDQWMPHLLSVRHDEARAALESVLAHIYDEHIQSCNRQLMPWASDLAQLADFAGSNLAQSAPDNPIARCAGITALPSQNPEQHSLWLSVLDLLLTKTGGWRARLTKNEGFPADGDKASKAFTKTRKGDLQVLIGELAEQTDLLEKLQQLRTLPPTTYSDGQWLLLDSLTRLLPQLAAYLRLSFQQLGATDFSEITQAALLALGNEDEPGEALLKLDYQIKHILVDEFQDTASPQMSLLQKLIAGWNIDDGRTLFIVGDGMQSCYGFRDANVGLFLDAHTNGIGNTPLQSLSLSVNFRSQAGVVNWVNDTFSRAYPEHDDISHGAVSYSPSGAFKPELDIAAVNCYACIVDKDGDDDDALATARDLEASKTLAIIQQIQAERPDDTIAVLVRSRPHLKQILQKLSDANLSWQATEIDALVSRMAIMDLLSLTRALESTADRLAWLALLRSPLIGLSLCDLHALAQHNFDENRTDLVGKWPLLWTQLENYTQNQNLSADGRNILDRCWPILRASHSERRRKSLRADIQATWISLGGPAALADSADIGNCESFFNLLDRHDKGAGIENWPNFLRSVKRLYAMPAPDANEKLQVMTIHKSKGLEFDTVIIPGLDKSPRQDDKELLLWQERIDNSGQLQLLLGPLAPAGEDADPLYKYLRDQAQHKDQLESTRLLYVGCTRAIKQLHLLAAVKQKEEQLQSPNKKSLLGCIWPSFAEQCQTLQEAPITSNCYNNIDNNSDSNADDHSKGQPILRIAPSWLRPELIANNLLADYRGQFLEAADLPDAATNPLNHPEAESAESRLARHTGTVLHSALEQLVPDGIQAWDTARINRQRPFWRAQLLQLGVASSALTASTEKLATWLANAVTDSESNWIFDAALPQSACELSLLYKGKEIIIDRTFVHNNERWIVDYKSSEPSANQSLEDFLAHESHSYQPQLRRYAQAFAAINPQQVRTFLYFPAIKCLHPVDFNHIACAQKSISSLE